MTRFLVGMAIAPNILHEAMSTTNMLYSDPLLTIGDDGLCVRQYTLFQGDKCVPWTDVEWVKAIQPTLWNGRWRLGGTGSFATWFATDWGRPTRETIFVMKLRDQSMKIGFTVQDAQRVKQILAERGLLIDEQGDARPTPLPRETKPFWRWPAFYAVIAMLLAFAAQIIYYHPRLPQTVATHFNLHGAADGWGTKGMLIGVTAGGACLLAVVFLTISYAISLTPSAPIGRGFLWFGAATLALILAITYMAFRANLAASPTIGVAPMYALLAYLAVVAAIALLTFRRLARPV